MLTSNDIQLLVGALIVVRSGGAVEVTAGKWVWSDGTRSHRDVDITEGSGPGSMHGIEVKDHARRLSSDVVDGLIQKMADMPDVSARSVVSSSGFSRPALRLCDHHGVTPFLLSPFKPVRDGEFGESLAKLVPSVERRLHWDGVSAVVHIRGRPDSSGCQPETRLRLSGGQEHERIKSLGDLISAAIGQSSGSIGEAEAVQLPQGSPFDHAMTVAVQDFEIETEAGFKRIDKVELSGTATFTETNVPADFKILRHALDGTAIAACAAHLFPAGHLIAIASLPGSSVLSTRVFDPEVRGRKRVYRLRLA